MTERVIAGQQPVSQIQKDWEVLAKVLWRGRAAGVWIGILRTHVVGGASLDELRIQESISKEDLDRALGLLWDRGAVVFEAHYLSHRRRLKKRLVTLQASVVRKRDVIAKLRAQIAEIEDAI